MCTYLKYSEYLQIKNILFCQRILEICRYFWQQPLLMIQMFVSIVQVYRRIGTGTTRARCNACCIWCPFIFDSLVKKTALLSEVSLPSQTRPMTRSESKEEIVRRIRFRTNFSFEAFQSPFRSTELFAIYLGPVQV